MTGNRKFKEETLTSCNYSILSMGDDLRLQAILCHLYTWQAIEVQVTDAVMQDH